MAISWRERTLLLSYLIALAHEFHRADEREKILNTIGAHLLYLPPCRHDDVGKVWRAVTTLSFSIFRLAVEFIWSAGYRPDIEKSSFFVSLDSSCWQLVRQMAGACRLRRQTSQYRISSRFEPTLCRVSYLFFSFPAYHHYVGYITASFEFLY